MGRSTHAHKQQRLGASSGPLDARRLGEEAARAIGKENWAKAEELYLRIVGLGIENAGVYNNLATVCERQGGRVEEAFGYVARAFELAPADVQIRQNFLTLVQKYVERLVEAERGGEAIPQARGWVEVDPKSARAQRALGKCHAQAGALGEALKYFTRAINLDPNNATYYNDFGVACYDLRLLAEAQNAFEQVLRLAPQSVVAYAHLGMLANLAGVTGLAVSFLRRALEIDPNCGEALNNMALYLRDQGEQALCRAHYERAIAQKPRDWRIFSSYLLSLNDDPNGDPAWIAAEHRRFQKLVEGPTRIFHGDEKDAERPLRVAYLSPDFRAHSVSYFIAPLVEAHHRDKVKVVCYSSGNTEDAVTERIRSAADKWRKVFRTTDEELAAIAAEDGIDVLVELSGHTSDNRLPAMAKRIAPIQVTYLGYPNTTGLREMDYRVTDAIADPPGEADTLHSEGLMRIEGGFLAYQPGEWAKNLAVAELPARQAGHITFGSFNNLAKINDVVLDTWAAILEKVPGSRLFLKARGLRDEKVQARVFRAFTARGIDIGQRLRMMGHERSAVDHHRHYNEVDVALDTFPYNGTTTTCEALWMGVPVVCFEGRSHAGRVGASLLSAAGLREWVAKDRDEYIEKAASWATRIEELAALRASLRERLLSSPLFDAQRLASGLEDGYRNAWRQFCSARTRTGTHG